MTCLGDSGESSFHANYGDGGSRRDLRAERARCSLARPPFAGRAGRTGGYEAKLPERLGARHEEPDRARPGAAGGCARGGAWLAIGAGLELRREGVRRAEGLTAVATRFHLADARSIRLIYR